MVNPKTLNTEQKNQNSLLIDEMSITEVLKTINNEDKQISLEVEKAIPDIKKVVLLAQGALKKGGRVFYVGAGTSGRLGVLDASECPPTYSVSKDCFIGVIAGGDKALRESIEGAEDNSKAAIEDLTKYQISKNDLIIGVSCSGAANYVISSLDFAKKNNAKTAYLITNPSPLLMTDVDVVISVDTGPEVITGSTRMKGGTATKMILNMISTSTMILMGKVYGNLMVDLMAVNKKLIDRGIRIIQDVTGVNYDHAEQALLNANKSVKLAIVMIKEDCDINKATEKLTDVDGFLSRVIDK